MICPNCTFENPDIAKFCLNCGNAMPIICPACGTENLPVARFCMNCGNRLADQAAVRPISPAVNSLSIDPRLEHLTAAAPDPLVEKIRKTHLAGERRIVTALFADVVDSTSLAEQMDPEDWAVVMNQAFERLVPVIYHYEGTIARLMGDALLAFFGAPVAHEDDPIRAVSAALDLISAARDYAKEVWQKYGIDFALRVGLNTGPVMVGEVGSNLVYEYTAMGDAVNLAARMQAAARPMNVLIAENTYRFIAHAFAVEDMGRISVKGKAEPVQVYEVHAAKGKPETLKLRGLRGLFSPVVGRNAELAALAQASTAVRAGIGRVVLVVGEAGLGKSRLVDEWKAREEADHPGSIRWIEGRCLSYGQGLAYQLLINVLLATLNVTESTPEDEKIEALNRMTSELFGKAASEGKPYLAHMLSLPLESSIRESVLNLDPQALQQQYFKTVRQVIQAAVRRQPLTILLEDIHWGDPSSLDLLTRLLPLASELPVLFCFVLRPEPDSPGWKIVQMARERYGHSLVELNLQLLTEADSQRLVSNLLVTGELPERVFDLIVQKAEGNPLFVEEVIRTLIDRGALVRRSDGWSVEKEINTLEIPDTLQGLLLARIDRLPDDVKHTLRVASVLGRQFSVKVLEDVLRSDVVSSVRKNIAQLESAGLLELATIHPELQYAFRHTFFQEAAYESLVKQERQSLHRQVGVTLERVYPNRLEEYAARLAVHFDLGAEPEIACRYFRLAGDTAARAYANTEAAMHYRRAYELILANQSFQASESGLLGGIMARLGQSLEIIGSYAEAVEVYERVENQARILGNQSLELTALMKRTTILSTPSPLFDTMLGRALSEQALQMAQNLGDEAAMARIYWNKMLAGFFDGEINEAVKYGELSLDLARQLNLTEQIAYTQNDLANYAYIPKGEFDRGLAYLDDAIRLWQDLDNQHMLADSLSTKVNVYFFRGEYQKAIEYAQEAYQISTRIGNPWGQAYSRGWAGMVYAEMGWLREAFAALNESIILGVESGFLGMKTIATTTMSFTLSCLGDEDQACQYAERSIRSAEKESPFWSAIAYSMQAYCQMLAENLPAAQQSLQQSSQRAQEKLSFVFEVFLEIIRGEIHLTLGEYEQAASIAKFAIPILRHRSHRSHLPYFLMILGKAYLGLGQLDQASQALEEGRELAAEIQARLILWKILAEIVELETRRGDLPAAAQAHHEGQGELEFLLGQIDDPALAEKLRGHPAARLLLNTRVEVHEGEL